MKKIEKLTKEQEALFPVYVDRWKKIGLCTDPANRPEAEDGIRKAYAVANLKEPKILWYDSPLAMLVAKEKFVNPKASDKEVYKAIQNSLSNCGFGQHDASWLAVYAYFREVCGLVEETKRLEGIEKICKNAGWFMPFQNVCLISERHNVCKLDARDRIHCEDGPAIAYPDGWKIYAWHGIIVPEKVILHPDKLTPKEILAEENSQVRAVMIERFGFDRFMIEAKSEVLEKKGEYSLIMIPDPNFQRMVALKMTCPTTSAVYIHGVDPECKTIEEALAWKRGEGLQQNKFYRHGDVYLIDLNKQGKSSGYDDNLLWEK